MYVCRMYIYIYIVYVHSICIVYIYIYYIRLYPFMSNVAQRRRHIMFVYIYSFEEHTHYPRWLTTGMVNQSVCWGMTGYNGIDQLTPSPFPSQTNSLHALEEWIQESLASGGRIIVFLPAHSWKSIHISCWLVISPSYSYDVWLVSSPLTTWIPPINPLQIIETFDPTDQDRQWLLVLRHGHGLHAPGTRCGGQGEWTRREWQRWT